MSLRPPFTRVFTALALCLLAIVACNGQAVKRLVIVKIDGLPGHFVDRYVKQRDNTTGRSVLPWIDEVFYKNGTYLENFYTRGMSLSAPSWSTIDTGQHLQLKGNVEFDRYTLRTYDYLNFFPYYVNYGLKRVADMPAVEILDELKVPLMYDAFPYERRYISQQLFQRGNNWEVLAGGFIRLYPGNVSDMIDEWTLGLNFRGMNFAQATRDVVNRIEKRPEVDYIDFYEVSFDHIAHGNNNPKDQLADLKRLDTTIGRFWTAIQRSSRSDETALVVVSDHGFNTSSKVYSQGFNLVKLLNSREGGGHHVITKRYQMQNYIVKGVYPLMPYIRNESKESFYLSGAAAEYATALVDFDGNERSSVHFRNSDLNMIHILLQQLDRRDLPQDIRRAAIKALFDTIKKHRDEWQTKYSQISEELSVLERMTSERQGAIENAQKKFTADELALGKDKEVQRTYALHELGKSTQAAYRKYAASLSLLLNLNPDAINSGKLTVSDVIPPGSMGERNSLYDLQNYIVGLGPAGLAVNADGQLDIKTSFRRVDYFRIFKDQSVRNNVQREVSSRPIDFVAVRVPLASFSGNLTGEQMADTDPLWIYGSDAKQALILSRRDGNGMSLRYLPIRNLRQDTSGKTTFEAAEWGAGFPLRIFEDLDLNIPVNADRAKWLSDWHDEVEWLRATHKTVYSNAIIGLKEQLDSHPVTPPDTEFASKEDRLIARFRQRQRHLAEADMLILANDHWNFDAKGFNAGGNHGSFFRISVHSTFMIAGGNKTGIPRGLKVTEPYDNLSVVPTLFGLMGKIDCRNQPLKPLEAMGFRRFPGRAVSSLVTCP